MASLLEYTCPNCGGKIEFDSDTQKMKCPYCDTEFDVGTLAAYDEELKGAKADEMQWQTPNETWAENELGDDGVKIYVCESCGGEVVAEATAAAMRCPWCDSPIVMKGNVAGSLRPDCVIPFKLDKEAAKEQFRKHLTGKKFLPTVFAEENHIDEIKGIYVPFWLFDADADANIHYRGTRRHSWRSGDYLYTRTDHYSLIREGDLGFSGIPVDGSVKMPDDMMESLEPFPQKDLAEFQTAYLSGYLADRYDVSSEDSVTRANTRVKKSVEDYFRSTVNGFGTVTVQSSNVQIDNGKVRYALLPVWILNTTWNGKNYMFAMNGQTGKFVGNLPLDKKAKNKFFWSRFGIASAISFAAVALIWLLMHL